MQAAISEEKADIPVRLEFGPVALRHASHVGRRQMEGLMGAALTG